MNEVHTHPHRVSTGLWVAVFAVALLAWIAGMVLFGIFMPSPFTTKPLITTPGAPGAGPTEPTGAAPQGQQPAQGGNQGMMMQPGQGPMMQPQGHQGAMMQPQAQPQTGQPSQAQPMGQPPRTQVTHQGVTLDQVVTSSSLPKLFTYDNKTWQATDFGKYAMTAGVQMISAGSAVNGNTVYYKSGAVAPYKVVYLKAGQKYKDTWVEYRPQPSSGQPTR